jgi:penicillin amidase
MDTTKAWPIEYKLLGVKPEQWAPWHCILAYKVRNTAEGTFHNKLWMARLAAETGAERAAAITPGYLPGHLLTVPPGAEYRGPVENAVRELTETAQHMAHFQDPGGESNGWVVSGARTASGKPLVAGDSHRTLDTPNVYYQTHLSCPAFSAIGHAVPGFPGVLHFMHNEYVAWGMTHGMGDTQDLFVEQFRETAGPSPHSPGTPGPGQPGAGQGSREYLFKGEWLKAEVTAETMRVRGGKDEEIEVTETRHGPVIEGDPAKGWGIALSDPGSAGATKWVDAAYNAMKCKSADEFEAAMEAWTDRTNNYPYADVQGNFGYALRGYIPVRSRANAWGPVPGWTGEHEWQGMIPPKELPRTRNPEEGWVVTCNQRTVDETYPHYIGNAWAPGWRAARIASRIADVASKDGKMTVAGMAAIHSERVSLPAKTLSAALKAVQPRGPAAQKARAMLLAWDGTMDRRRPEGAVFSTVISEVMTVLAHHHYGKLAEDALSVVGSGGDTHIRRYLHPLMVDRMSKNDPSILPPGQTWATVLGGALERAVAVLQGQLGVDMTTWRWGSLHHTAHQHPLSAAFPEAAGALNPPQVATSGDGDTPLAGAHGTLTYTCGAASVNRYVHDPSDWRNSRWIVPLGASGHPGSRHYSDQQQTWANVETIPMLWDFGDIEKDAESAQRLGPG